MNLHRILLIGLALALAGCETVDLSRHTAAYEVLIQKQQQPTLQPKLHGPNDVVASLEEEKVEIDAKLRTLAADTYATAQKAKGPTQVAAYRLAAMAAWRGGDGQVLADAQRAGMEACARLPEGPGLPRDCALLAYVDILRDHKNLVQRQNLITQKTPADMKLMLDIVVELEELGFRQWKVLPKIVDGDKPYARLHPATLAYIQQVSASSACMVRWAFFFGRGTPVFDERTILVRKSAEVAANPYQQIAIKIRMVDPTVSDWMTAVTPATCPNS